MTVNLYIHNFETLTPRLSISEHSYWISFTEITECDHRVHTDEKFVIYFECEHHARQMFALLEKWRPNPEGKGD